ncbi:MAG: tetratricopeptide repeat protein [Candidatus Omnitrophota bacterium]
MKKRIRDLSVMILMVLTISVFAVNSYAQEGRGNGRLLGQVMDKDKNPIVGVKITLQYTQYSNRSDTTSDKKGQWGFFGLGMGQVKITAEKEGYRPEVTMLSVSGVSQNPKVTITMYKLDEVQSAEKGKEQPEDKVKADFEKAANLFKQAKYDEALAIFKELYAAKPEYYQLRFNIGLCYVEMQRYDDAITELQAVLDKMLAPPAEQQPAGKDAQAQPQTQPAPSPESQKAELAKVYAAMGDVYMRQNKFTQASEYFKKSIDISPTDYTLPYNVAEVLFAAGKTDEAIPYYQMAIKIKPDWPKAYMQLGYAYLNKGDMKLATENFNKFLELAPNSPDADGVKEVLKSLK